MSTYCAASVVPGVATNREVMAGAATPTTTPLEVAFTCTPLSLRAVTMQNRRVPAGTSKSPRLAKVTSVSNPTSVQATASAWSSAVPTATVYQMNSDLGSVKPFQLHV